MNKTKITNFNLMPDSIQISWKMKMEPKKALQNNMAHERGAARLPAAQHHTPRTHPDKAGEHRVPFGLQAMADIMGRVHGRVLGRDAETLQ